MARHRPWRYARAVRKLCKLKGTRADKPEADDFTVTAQDAIADLKMLAAASVSAWGQKTKKTTCSLHEQMRNEPVFPVTVTGVRLCTNPLFYHSAPPPTWFVTSSTSENPGAED